MSTAKNHRIVAVDAAELARYRQQREKGSGPWCSTTIWDPKAKLPLACDALPVFVESYDYDMPRLGKTLTSRRLLCAQHGQAFAEKYGLSLPEKA